MLLGRKKSNGVQYHQMNLLDFIRLNKQGEFDLSFEQCQELYRDLTKKGINAIPDKDLVGIEEFVSLALACNTVEDSTVRDNLEPLLVSLRERIESLS
jgi:hypothetical protein